MFILYRVSSHRCTLELVGTFLTFLVECAPLRRVEHTRKHEDRRIEMTFQVNGPAFFATYTALCAFKKTEKNNEVNAHFACMHGKSLVTMSAHLRRVEHTWRRAHRRIDVTFQVNGPAFSPLNRAYARSKRRRSAIKRTYTSPACMASPSLQ